MMTTHDDSGVDDPIDPIRKCHTRTDQQIDADIDEALNNPINDPDLDIVMASEVIQDIDSRSAQ